MGDHLRQARNTRERRTKAAQRVAAIAAALHQVERSRGLAQDTHPFGGKAGLERQFLRPLGRWARRAAMSRSTKARRTWLNGRNRRRGRTTPRHPCGPSGRQRARGPRRVGRRATREARCARHIAVRQAGAGGVAVVADGHGQAVCCAGTTGVRRSAVLRTMSQSAASPGQDGMEAMAPDRISSSRRIAPLTPSCATALGRPLISS
jgi:hypothetical protein